MANLRLTMQTFSNWLQARINEHPDFPKFLVTYARQPDMPDRCLTILRVGGGKDRHDSYFEEVPFRFQTRGRSESVEDAENFAMMIDDIINDLSNIKMPVSRGAGSNAHYVGDIYVTDAWAVNKPKQMPITDKQSRYQFSADYLVLASRYNEEV